MIADTLRRALDILGGAFGLVISAPILIVAGLAIWVTDGGPVLFDQVREGREGRPIRIWKLRTMVRDADRLLAAHLAADGDARREWERYLRLADDPRILGRPGRMARRFSVDELPQFWSVVRGDMSLVGPRPLPVGVTEMVPAEFLAARSTVRPGLTGLWQISGRSDLDIDGMAKLDIRYLRERSVITDLRIILATPAVIFGGSGAF